MRLKQWAWGLLHAVSMNLASGPKLGRINQGEEMHFLGLCFYPTCYQEASVPHCLSSLFEQGSEVGWVGGRKILGGGIQSAMAGSLMGVYREVGVGGSLLGGLSVQQGRLWLLPKRLSLS